MIREHSIKREFRPFPSLSNRAAWADMPSDIRDSTIRRANSYLGSNWESLLAVRYMDFARDGNRSRYEKAYFERRDRLFDLLAAECFTAEGRYIEAIINGVWLICEETTWVIPAHNNHDQQGHDELGNIERSIYIDLFAAETGALLSWIHYFLGEKLAMAAPLVKRRIEFEIGRRIIRPYLTHSDFGWMGLEHGEPVNNWNPWINSNILVCLLSIATQTDPLNVDIGLGKCIRSINRFLQDYAEDGGCDEGPAYFGVAGASALDCLETLNCIDDLDYIYQETRIRNMAAYIYKVYIGDGYYVNYADAAPRVQVPAALLARTALKTGDPNLAAFAALSDRSDQSAQPLRSTKLFRRISDWFTRLPEGEFHAPAFSYFGGIQVLTRRQATGLFWTAKGGHNAESHNHNDIGNFLLYNNAVPVLIDAGVETYSKQTFSEKRYELWTMQSAYHNTPTINGLDQAAGRNYGSRAVEVERGGNAFSMELSEAYPRDAGIRSYRRNFDFSTEGRLVLTDIMDLAELREALVLNFLCYHRPEIGSGQINLGGQLLMRYEAFSFKPEIDKIVLTDPKIRQDWNMEHVYRIRLIQTDRQAKKQVQIAFESYETH